MFPRRAQPFLPDDPRRHGHDLFQRLVEAQAARDEALGSSYRLAPRLVGHALDALDLVLGELHAGNAASLALAPRQHGSQHDLCVRLGQDDARDLSTVLAPDDIELRLRRAEQDQDRGNRERTRGFSFRCPKRTEPGS